MKKIIVWLTVIVVLGLVSFIGGYYFSSGGFAGLPGLGTEDKALQVDREQKEKEEAEEEGYRILLREETDPEKGWKESDDPEPVEVVEERDGAVITRRPFGDVVLAVILDASGGLAGKPGRAVLEEMTAGLTGFLKNPPAGLKTGVRTMGGGEEGTCREGLLLVPAGEVDIRNIGRFEPGGPRNVSRAMYLAVGDMATMRGKKGIVILTAGEDECGEWPCEKAESLLTTRERIRTFVVKVEPEGIPEGDDEAAPGSGEAGGGPSVFQPSAEDVKDGKGSLECIAEAGGGFRETVRGREEVESALRRAAAELSRNVTVRFFRSRSKELTGRDDPRMTRWRVDVSPILSSMKVPVSSSTLPARFRLFPGHYKVTGTYGEAESVVRDLDIIAGEEVEVRMNFRVGQLMVLEGDEGWPEGITGCQPLVRVYPYSGMKLNAAEKCGLPAQFVLLPGEYIVDVIPESGSSSLYNVRVSAGRAAILKVSPEEQVAEDSIDELIEMPR